MPFAPVRMPAQDGVPQDFVEIAAKAVADAATPDRAGAGAADLAVGQRVLQPRPRGRAALARRSRRGAHLDDARRRADGRRRRAVRRRDVAARERARHSRAGRHGIPPRRGRRRQPGLHRDRRHAARVGRGRVRGRRLGALRPDAARGSGAERPDHQAAGGSEAPGASAAAPAAGARRPAADGAG